jgi:hypothetical protein
MSQVSPVDTASSAAVVENYAPHLDANGLDHDLLGYHGGHALTGPRVRDTLAPFFAEAFGLRG